MNWYSLKNRIKYNWKRTLAILFASLGVAMQMGLFVILFVGGTPDFLTIISYFIVLVAYYYLLTGNIKGTTIAYRGMMLFVFFTFFDFATFFLLNFLSLGGLIFSSDVITSVLSIAMLASWVLGFVGGLMTYISFKRYSTFGNKTTYETVRNWCLLFVISVIVSYGLTIALDVLAYMSEGVTDSVTIFLNVMEPVSVICMALCTYFTVLRLKEN